MPAAISPARSPRSLPRLPPLSTTTAASRQSKRTFHGPCDSHRALLPLVTPLTELTWTATSRCTGRRVGWKPVPRSIMMACIFTPSTPTLTSTSLTPPTIPTSFRRRPITFHTASRTVLSRRRPAKRACAIWATSRKSTVLPALRPEETPQPFAESIAAFKVRSQVLHELPSPRYASLARWVGEKLEVPSQSVLVWRRDTCFPAAKRENAAPLRGGSHHALAHVRRFHGAAHHGWRDRNFTSTLLLGRSGKREYPASVRYSHPVFARHGADELQLRDAGPERLEPLSAL